MATILEDLIERLNGKWLYREYRGDLVYSKAISVTVGRRFAYINLFHINPKTFRVWESGVNYLEKLNKYSVIDDLDEIAKAEAILKKALVMGLLKDKLSNSIILNDKINVLKLDQKVK